LSGFLFADALVEFVPPDVVWPDVPELPPLLFEPDLPELLHAATSPTLATAATAMTLLRNIWSPFMVN
jgi:hypothetical protein